MNKAFTTMQLGTSGIIPARNAFGKRWTRAELASSMMEMISVLECQGLNSASQRAKLSGAAPWRNGHVDA